MMGIRVTRESALAELESIERELRIEIQGAAKYNALPRGSRAYNAWVTAKEMRLATLDALRALVMALPAHQVLLEEEDSSPVPCGWCKTAPGTRPDPFGGADVCLDCQHELRRGGK